MADGFHRLDLPSQALAVAPLLSGKTEEKNGDMLKHPDLEYKDLGVDYFDRMEPERLQRYLVKRLERLGYRVTLTREADAA
jgi:hypothetical protein